MKKNDLKVMFSKASDNWTTPKPIYTHFVEELGYNDYCPLDADVSVDGLKVKWRGNVYINPPYSNIKDFVDKAIEHHQTNNRKVDIVFLIPSRTDTKYFQKLLNYGVDIQFIKGRLKFGNSKNSAPFPSCFIKLSGTGESKIINNIYQR